MKQKILCILMAMSLIGSVLSGCGSSSNGETNVDNGEKSTEAAKDNTSEQSETKELDKSPREVNYIEDFDAATHEDRIKYAEIEELYGPVPIDELPDNITFGALLPDLSNEFWTFVAEGEKKAGEDFGITIESQSAMNETDYDAQLSMGETMVSNNYDAYIFSALSDDCLTSVAEKALKSGAPVINPCGQLVKNADVFVGAMDYQVGVAAAEYVLEKFPEGCQAAVCMGQQGTAVPVARTSGFEDTVKDTDVEVVTELPAEWNAEKAMNMTVDMFNTFPNVEVIFCNNDNMALGVIEGLRSINKLDSVMVIGVDGTSGGYESIEKGELTATVDTFPADCGYIAVEMAIRILAGQDIPRVIETPIACVDKDNMAEYKR